MTWTHLAQVRSSGRYVRVERIGRLLIVESPGRRHHLPQPSQSVHTLRYDARLRLLPAPALEIYNGG